jgi:hypothetical protein
MPGATPRRHRPKPSELAIAVGLELLGVASRVLGLNANIGSMRTLLVRGMIFHSQGYDEFVASAIKQQSVGRI